MLIPEVYYNILTDKNGKKMSTADFDKKGCYSYQKICAVTMPILVSMLVEHVIGLTDTAFLGRVSEVALGASALGSVYFLAFFVLGSGFSFGAQILIARRNGEKNFRKTGHIWKNSWDLNKAKNKIGNNFLLYFSKKRLFPH